MTRSATPSDDLNYFTYTDPRVMGCGTEVYVDGELCEFVVNAYVGEKGWVDYYPSENGRMILVSNEPDIVHT